MATAAPKCVACGHAKSKHATGPRGGCTARKPYGKRTAGRVKVAAIGVCNCPVYKTPEE